MSNDNIPLLAYDGTVPAIIEPSEQRQPIEGLPPFAVMCFFREVIEQLAEAGELIHRSDIKIDSENGEHRAYEWQLEQGNVIVVHAQVGAPLSAGILEYLIAAGCNRIMAVGSSGSLDPGLTLGHVVVPNEAVRDEGTSYHYLPPSRTVVANPEGVAALEACLTAHGVPFVTGKTWTTDGFFRETRGKVSARQAEGCLVVEMEAAAFMAVAQFRKVMFAQILYAGDDLTADEWDSREFTSITEKREALLRLAAAACLQLPLVTPAEHQ